MSIEPDDGNGGTFVKVTNREIYSKLVSMELALAAANGRLDLMAKDNQTLRESVAINTKRLEKLEARFGGILVGLGTGIVVGLIALFKGVIG